jgi:Cu+-exporting ATPase
LAKETYILSKDKTDTNHGECYHCGESCEPGETVHFDDKAFCCHGCKSVYQILQEAELCDIYDLDDRAATVKRADNRKYRILDEPELAKNFLEFEGQGIAKVTFFAPNIHCSSCIWLLEHMGRLHEGVLQSTVQFVKKEVSITFKTEFITLKEVAELMDQIGYGPVVEPRKQKKSQSRGLIIRLAVAGFCFGNSMLISLPDYLDLQFQIPEDYQTIFAYINLLFGLPVFFYSAQIYFLSAWKGLKHKFINIDVPISLGIIALFARSVIDILVYHEMGFMDSLAGLVFFLLIGRWFQHQTYQALSFDRDISTYFPIAVSKWIDGKEVTTKIQELHEGDQLMIHNQELIPADAILVQGPASIDYSFVTGESIPAPIEPGEKLYAGGRQLGGSIIIQLQRRVLNSHLTKLWNQSNEEEKAGLTNLSDLISRYFTAAVLILALLGGVMWYFKDPTQAVNVFTAILIVACPCALALAVPFTYGHTMRIFGNLGLYIKHVQVIEELSRIRRIVFDKTGTLTRPLPEEVKYNGQILSNDQKIMIHSAAANSIHPLSKIVKKYLSSSIVFPKDPIRWDEYEEVTGKGIVARLGDHVVQLGSAIWLGQDNKEHNHLTSVHVKIDGVYLGFFQFENAYREGVFDVLDKLKRDYNLDLLSGDNDKERNRLSSYFDTLKFKQSPADKLMYVQEITNQSVPVLMIGDGLNDAGALQASSTGISLSDDIYQFTPASDAILDASQISELQNFLSFTRFAVKVVWAAFVISLLYNLVGLSFAFTGQLTPLVSSILMPISSVTVVGFITLATQWKARSFFK